MFGEKHFAHFSQTIIAMPGSNPYITRPDEQIQVQNTHSQMKFLKKSTCSIRIIQKYNFRQGPSAQSLCNIFRAGAKNILRVVSDHSILALSVFLRGGGEQF